MTSSHFYAMLSRMKYINRWGLMNNTRLENISEHSQQVAILTHCLVLIHNKRFGGELDAQRAALLAVFHDSTEIITGDMPTPIKYQNPEIIDAYKQIEDRAADRLISLLPEDFRDDYSTILKQNGKDDDKLHVFVKAADRYSALIKCIEETVSGNREFEAARESTLKAIKEMKCEAADIFLNEFIESFYLPIDDIK